jgi:isoquinoline 1-oxidoreductase alpha subunit
MDAKYELQINGEQHVVECPADMPLLWVLRDRLALTGTKYGCGMGQCGACTVHVGSDAHRACIFPVAAVGSQPVTTIEGLADVGYADLIAAWVEHRVPQCGYCQAGMLMSVAAALDKGVEVDGDSVRAGLSNLCRCGTYPRIARALDAVLAARRASRRSQR